MSTMGTRIRTLREAHNVSRPIMAERLDDMPPTTLKNYELGYRQVSGAILESIGRNFGQAWVLFVLGLAAQPKGRVKEQAA